MANCSPSLTPFALLARTWGLAFTACALAALAGCQGSDKLDDSGCLPLKAPVQVTLLQATGLYQVGDAEPLVLMTQSRDTVNDDFNRVRLVRALAAGTPVRIDRLSQAWGFDVGKGRISAFGTAPDGQRFEYGWGGGTTLGRAPWESASVPNLRTVDCGK